MVKAVAWEIDGEVIKMAESMHGKLPWVVEARGDVRHMGKYLKGIKFDTDVKILAGGRQSMHEILPGNTVLG